MFPTTDEQLKQTLDMMQSGGASKDELKIVIDKFVDSKHTSQKAVEQPEEKGFFGRLRDAEKEGKQVTSQMKKDLVIGGAKSVGETLAGASSAGEGVIKAIGRTLTPKSLEDDLGFEKSEASVENVSQSLTGQSTEELFKPDNTTQSVGKVAGDIAQFAVPASKATGLVKTSQVAANASKGAKVANSLKNAGAIAGVDALASVPVMTAKEGEINNDALKDAAIGGAIGGGLNLAGDVISSLKTSGSDLFEKARKSAGQIAQGDPSDQLVMMKAIDEIDTGGIKTYNELSNTFDQSIQKNLGTLDDLLETSDVRLTASNASKTIKAGSDNIVQSPIDNALGALDEFYTNVKQPEDLARIRELKQAFDEGGLTLKQTNDLAREIGRQRSGFLASGNPSTSLSKQAYENVRTGLKDLVRTNISDDSAKLLDQQVSDFINAKSLSDDMIKKSEKLKQKISERGYGERAGRFIGTLVDKITLGGIKGIMQKLMVTSNRGFKTLNTLDLEDDVARNIKVIEQLADKLQDKSIRKALLNLDDAFKGIGEINIVPITKEGIDTIRNVGASIADEALSN